MNDNCYICAKTPVAKAGQMCGGCSTHTESENYEIIIARIDDAILRAKGLYSEAWRAGDQETMEITSQYIADMEVARVCLRKPGEPRR